VDLRLALLGQLLPGDRDHHEQQPDQRAGDARARQEEVMEVRRRHRGILAGEADGDDPRGRSLRDPLRDSAPTLPRPRASPSRSGRALARDDGEASGLAPSSRARCGREGACRSTGARTQEGPVWPLWFVRRVRRIRWRATRSRAAVALVMFGGRTVAGAGDRRGRAPSSQGGDQSPADDPHAAGPRGRSALAFLP
jgi:hypothetical protein